MTESPYTPPTEPSEIGPTGLTGGDPKAKLQRVALYQRLVIFALLANILVNIASLGIRGGGVQQSMTFVLALAITVVALGIVAFTMVSVFLLAKEVLNLVAAIFCALLMVIPCISLLVLLVVNQRATSYLQSQGVRVGFFGTSPGKI